MSPSLEGVDPALKWPLGKGDDDPGFSTLNDAKILGFEPAHDPNHRHIGQAGAWSSHTAQNLAGPEVVDKLDGFNGAELGLRGGPKCAQLLPKAQFEAELLAFYYQNRHGNKGTPAGIYGSLGS